MLFGRSRTVRLFAKKSKDRDPWESPFVLPFDEESEESSAQDPSYVFSRRKKDASGRFEIFQKKERENDSLRGAFWDTRPGEISFSRLDAAYAAQVEQRRSLSMREKEEIPNPLAQSPASVQDGVHSRTGVVWPRSLLRKGATTGSSTQEEAPVGRSFQVNRSDRLPSGSFKRGEQSYSRIERGIARVSPQPWQVQDRQKNQAMEASPEVASEKGEGLPGSVLSQTAKRFEESQKPTSPVRGVFHPARRDQFADHPTPQKRGGFDAFRKTESPAYSQDWKRQTINGQEGRPSLLNASFAGSEPTPNAISFGAQGVTRSEESNENALGREDFLPQTAQTRAEAFQRWDERILPQQSQNPEEEPEKPLTTAASLGTSQDDRGTPSFSLEPLPGRPFTGGKTKQTRGANGLGGFFPRNFHRRKGMEIPSSAAYQPQEASSFVMPFQPDSEQEEEMLQSWEEAVQSALRASQTAETGGRIDPQQKLFEADPAAATSRTAVRSQSEAFPNASPATPPPLSETQSSISQATPTPPLPPVDVLPKRRSLFSSDAFLTIVLAAGVLLLCVLLLWIVSRRSVPHSAPLGETGAIIRIPSPKAFKIRPEEPTRPLIPYQDELIYGKLDPQDQDDEKERVLPPPAFAPELLIEQETSEDEYLDDVVEDTDGDEEPARSPSVEVRSTAIPQKVIAKTAKTPELPPMKLSKKEAPRKVHPLSDSLKNAKTSTQKPSARKTKEPKEKARTSETHVAQSTAFYVQLGILPSVEVARKESSRLVAKYRLLTRYHLIVRPVKTDAGRTIYRLLVGPFATKEQAEVISKNLGMKFKILS